MNLNIKFTHGSQQTRVLTHSTTAADKGDDNQNNTKNNEDIWQ